MESLIGVNTRFDPRTSFAWAGEGPAGYAQSRGERLPSGRDVDGNYLFTHAVSKARSYR
jgi:hypothetical protein